MCFESVKLNWCIQSWVLCSGISSLPQKWVRSDWSQIWQIWDFSYFSTFWLDEHWQRGLIFQLCCVYSIDVCEGVTNCQTFMSVQLIIVWEELDSHQWAKGLNWFYKYRLGLSVVSPISDTKYVWNLTMNGVTWCQVSRACLIYWLNKEMRSLYTKSEILPSFNTLTRQFIIRCVFVETVRCQIIRISLYLNNKKVFPFGELGFS